MAITIDGTNGLTTDNAALKLDGTTLAVDDTNNRVGIGTSGPVAKLDVYNPTQTSSISHTIGDYSIRLNAPTTTNYFGGGIAWSEGTYAPVSISAYDAGIGGALGLVFATGNNTSTAESMRIDSNGNLKFNSGYGSVATAYGCRAWVNFNGTGTVAIRASGNVSSITDTGTGLYTVNFTTSMPDADYAVIGTCSTQSTSVNSKTVNTREDSTPSTGSVPILVKVDGTQTNEDRAYVFISIFR